MMENNILQSGRLVWLDWMKVMAILSIIWGHFFSEGHVYLYVFSVQVFCVISGFLYKRSPNWKTCITKCFWQLLVPTIIMSIIPHMETYLRGLAMGQSSSFPWLWFFKWLLLGDHWCMGTCWYFYSLIVMRLIMQLLPEKKWIYILLFIILSGGAIALHQVGFVIKNANVNVLVCMPLFLIGVFLKSLKSVFSQLHNFWIEVGVLVVAVLLVILCGHYNGYVWMYLCGYGNNFGLYILGGVAGTAMLYVPSLWLGRLPYYNMIQTISKGSILIIGLHVMIVRRLTELSDRTWGEDFFFSLMILLFFIPVVHLAERFFPILLGKRK